MAEPPPVLRFVGGGSVQADRSLGSKTVPDYLHHLQELFLAYALKDL